MDMSKGDALAALGKLLQPINVEAVKPLERRWTLAELIDEAYLPYCRRKWKQSTAETIYDGQIESSWEFPFDYLLRVISNVFRTMDCAAFSDDVFAAAKSTITASRVAESS
jgi:hypothetical protein